MLSNCGTDFQNPFAREWAILCVRNACDNSQGNQDFVASLRPQGATIVDPWLASQGLSVAIDKDTGKLAISSAIRTPEEKETMK